MKNNKLQTMIGPKRLLLAITIALLTSVCGAQQSYTIVGTLRNPTPGEIIYLKNTDNGQILDTVTVSATGSFAFHGCVTTPYIVTILSDSCWVDAIIEAGTLEIVLNERNESTVRGTLLNRGAQQFRNLLNKSVAEYNELDDHLTLDLELPRDSVEKRLSEFIKTNDSVNYRYIETLYNANRGNTLGTYLLFSWADVLTPEQFAPIWRQASNASKNFAPLQRVANANIAKLFNAVGNKFPDCLLQNAERQPVNVAHFFDGKSVVLLNFWASWCGYCNVNKEHIAALAQKYGESLKIVNINVSDIPEKALEVIGTKPYPGVYLLDVDNTAKKLYGIDIYPTAIIVSPTGAILMRHEGVIATSVDEIIQEECK